jgi:hypothetical protein
MIGRESTSGKSAGDTWEVSTAMCHSPPADDGTVKRRSSRVALNKKHSEGRYPPSDGSLITHPIWLSCPCQSGVVPSAPIHSISYSLLSEVRFGKDRSTHKEESLPSQRVDPELALCAQLTQKISLLLEQSEDLVILLL